MNTQYVTVVTDSTLMVMDTGDGESVNINKDDPSWNRACELVKSGYYADVFNLSPKHAVSNFFSDDITVKIDIIDGEGIITLTEFNDMKVPLQSAITDKIVKMNSQGFSALPLANFISNLYRNPSSVAIDELYLFIDKCNLPITQDGNFIAYKIVKENYFDIYTGTMDNSIGKIVSVPRHTVDTNRNNTCSSGLHFCSKNYLNHYGTSAKDTDRCMLVSINPADVVSIPSDYSNAKGRTWTYEVVGEVTGKWRDTLPEKDYTDDSVVSKSGDELEDSDDSRYDDPDDYCPCDDCTAVCTTDCDLCDAEPCKSESCPDDCTMCCHSDGASCGFDNTSTFCTKTCDGGRSDGNFPCIGNTNQSNCGCMECDLGNQDVVNEIVVQLPKDWYHMGWDDHRVNNIRNMMTVPINCQSAYQKGISDRKAHKKFQYK